MSVVTDLVVELGGVATMIAKRIRASAAQSDAGALELKVATQLKNKISYLTVLDTNGSALLFEAIANSGLTGKYKEMLVTAVDDKLLSVPDVSSATPGNITQKLLNPEAWMTESLLETFQSPRKSLEIKCQILADYFTRCGCNHPHEQTYKWWFAAVLALHFTEGWPSYKTIFEQYEQLKDNVAASRKKWPFPTIYQYPKTPHQLPDAVYAHMFGDDMLSTCQIPRLAQIANHHIPLRKNSKLLLSDMKANRSLVAQGAGHTYSAPCHASSGGAGSSAAHADSERRLWVQELMDLIKNSFVRQHPQPEPASTPTKREQVESALASLSQDEGKPKWAAALLAMVKGERSEDGGSPAAPTAPTRLGNEETVKPERTPDRCELGVKDMAASLRPKSAIGLRMSQKTPASTSGASSSADRMTTAQYEQLAMNAMQSVKEKRAGEAEQRRREREAGKSCEKEVARTRVKPKMAAVERKLHPAAMASPLKRPAGAAPACGFGKKRPRCPSMSQSDALLYNGGKVYNSIKRMSFRCLRVANNTYPEKSCAWKDDREQAWERALDAIDDYRRQGK